MYAHNSKYIQNMHAFMYVCIYVYMHVQECWVIVSDHSVWHASLAFLQSLRSSRGMLDLTDSLQQNPIQHHTISAFDAFRTLVAPAPNGSMGWRELVESPTRSVAPLTCPVVGVLRHWLRTLSRNLTRQLASLQGIDRTPRKKHLYWLVF